MTKKVKYVPTFSLSLFLIRHQECCSTQERQQHVLFEGPGPQTKININTHSEFVKAG